jgi:hypothetical protein
MTLGTLITQAQNGTINQIQKRDLPVKISFKLKKEFDKFEKPIEHYQELYNQLIDKYGEKGKPDENGNTRFKVKNDCLATWNSEIESLNEEEVEVKYIWKSEDEFEEFIMKLSIDLTMDEVRLLEQFIEPEKEEEEEEVKEEEG